ncbi:MAG: ATP-dependent helicase C-terminal domain-containing protein, partial [Paracoccaceae bacterium]
RDPLRGVSCDLMERARALQGNHPQTRHGDVQRIRTEAGRLARLTPARRPSLSWAALAALAYPDRIGLRRAGPGARWKLSGGKGAWMHEADPMANAPLIVAVDLDGDAREAKIRLMVEISEAELRAIHGERIIWHNSCEWSAREGRVLARHQERFGALVLGDRAWRAAPAPELAAAALDGVRALGLPWSKAAQAFRNRVMAARAGAPDLPDMRDAALMGSLADWLAPYLADVRSASDIAALDILAALRAMLDHQQMRALERAAPAFFTTPMGRRAALDYSGDTPQLSVRVQEMFGLNVHPLIGGKPLRITLLSPAGRPVQTTLDLAGFWATSYAQVRKEMRGRYPKHPWPEDPTRAAPTLRASPRKR